MATIFVTDLQKEISIKKMAKFNHLRLIETSVTKGASFSVKYQLINDEEEKTEDNITFSEDDLDAFQFSRLTEEETNQIESAQSISKKMQLLIGFYISRKLKNDI